MWRVDVYGAVPGRWAAMYGLKLLDYMILDNCVINWHIFFFSHGKSREVSPQPKPIARVARSLRSLGRQPHTGKVQCQALQCGDHQLLASLLEGPSVHPRDYFLGGLG